MEVCQKFKTKGTETGAKESVLTYVSEAECRKKRNSLDFWHTSLFSFRKHFIHSYPLRSKGNIRVKMMPNIRHLPPHTAPVKLGEVVAVVIALGFAG